MFEADIAPQNGQLDRGSQTVSLLADDDLDEALVLSLLAAIPVSANGYGPAAADPATDGRKPKM